MITIFSTPTCPRCQILKEAFQKAGLAYEEKPLDASVMARVLCETDIWVQSAPLVLDGAVWKFQDDFFDSSGKLLPNWLKNLKGIKPKKARFTGKGGKPQEKHVDCKIIWR
jgi:hypothetical protein